MDYGARASLSVSPSGGAGFLQLLLIWLETWRGAVGVLPRLSFECIGEHASPL